MLVLNATGGVIFDSGTTPVPATVRSWTPLNGNASFQWASWSEAPSGAGVLTRTTKAGRRRWESGSTTIGAVYSNPTPYEQVSSMSMRGQAPGVCEFECS